MDDYMDYLFAIWACLPYLFYTFVFVTLVPKSLKRIIDFADANYEMNRYKYHRCYGPDICCHTYDPNLRPKQKPRKAVTRVYPKRQSQMHEKVDEANKPFLSKDHSTTKTYTSQKSAATTTSAAINGYKKQFYTHTNVNKIAKMFESGGVQKKINRVTPTTILTTPKLRRSSTVSATANISTAVEESDGDEAYYTLFKKRSFSLDKNNENLNIQVLNYNTEQQQQEQEQEQQEEQTLLIDDLNDEFSSTFTDNWSSEPLITRTSHNGHYEVPTTLKLANSSAATSIASTASPIRLSPYDGDSLSVSSINSPQRSLSPMHMDDNFNHSLTDDYHYTSSLSSLLNIKSSLEDIFTALARNAEKTDHISHLDDISDNPLSSPVTSIDDILSQRRLSRPLSAYSISDLLNDDITTNTVYTNDNFNTERSHNKIDLEVSHTMEVMP